MLKISKEERLARKVKNKELREAQKGVEELDASRARGHLKSALNKSNYSKHLKEFVSYCTPCEIIALINYGIRPSDDKDEQRAREDKKKGIATPQWFYFKLK